MFLVILTLVAVALGATIHSQAQLNSHDLTEAELLQLGSLGFKLATPEDRAAAKAAGIEWREVQSYAEILKLASELRSRLHNLNTEIFVGSKSVVRSFYGLGIPGKAKKESAVYDTVLCDAIMGAQVDQTCDPVSKRVRFSPPIHDKWWDVYGVCSFWLEDKWHSVSFPNGALKQSASATLVQPFGPVIFRKRISETVWWYS